jgi:hypothetical protein
MHEHEHPTHLIQKSHFTNLPLSFLFIYNLTKHQKINNMRFKNLTWFYDFLHVLYSASKFPTKY